MECFWVQFKVLEVTFKALYGLGLPSTYFFRSIAEAMLLVRVHSHCWQKWRTRSKDILLSHSLLHVQGWCQRSMGLDTGEGSVPKKGSIWPNWHLNLQHWRCRSLSQGSRTWCQPALPCSETWSHLATSQCFNGHSKTSVSCLLKAIGFAFFFCWCFLYYSLHFHVIRV